MPVQDNKISLRQLFIILFLITLSPAIRIFPQICSLYADTAGWLSALPAAIGFIVLSAILNSLFKNSSHADLNDVFKASVGKTGAKALLVLYFIWITILFFLYIRYYADRLLASIYPNTNIHFFLVAMFIPVLIALRGKIESFTRFCEFSILMFFLVFAIFFLFMSPAIKTKNLLPVTYYDIWPITKASYAIFGIWSYFFFLFFFGDQLKNKKDLVHHEKKVLVFLFITTTLILICVVGTLGPNLAQRMPIPFFSATKLISIVESFDRFEAVLLSIWVVSDFIVITVFGMLIMTIAKKLFNVSESKYFAAPVSALGYAGSLLLATSKFELEVFSNTFGLPVNIIMCFVVPLLILLIGKLRKKL